MPRRDLQDPLYQCEHTERFHCFTPSALEEARCIEYDRDSSENNIGMKFGLNGIVMSELHFNGSCNVIFCTLAIFISSRIESILSIPSANRCPIRELGN